MEPTPFSFQSLIKHCRNLIRTGEFSSGRISRGEYVVSYLIISLLGSVAAALLRQLAGQIGTDISSIFGIVLGVFGIKLIIKRSHDIGKSGWYYFRPVLTLIALLVISGAYVISQGLFSIGENNPGLDFAAIPMPLLRIFALAFLATGIRLVITVFMIFFKSGTTGDNAYGSDPLAHQPSSNGLYRGVGLVLLCASLLIGSFGQPGNYDGYMMDGTQDTVSTGAVEDTISVP